MESKFKDFDDFLEKTQGPENRDYFLRIMNFGYFMEGLGVLLNQKMAFVKNIYEISDSEAG